MRISQSFRGSHQSHPSSRLSSAIRPILKSLLFSFALCGPISQACAQEAEKLASLENQPSAAIEAASGDKAVAEKISTGSKGMLWQVKSGQHSLYIFGSIHAAKAEFYPLQAEVEAAYSQAQLLAVEIDVSDEEAMKNAMPLLTYKAPDKLEKHLKSATWHKMTATFGETSQQLQGYRPGAVVSVLLMQTFAQQGYSPEFGLDKYFISRAKADKKPLLELESVGFQAKILGGLSDADGDAWLSQTIDELHDGRAQAELDGLVKSWREGDTEALQTIIANSAAKDPVSLKLTKMLFDQRNIGMSKKIATLLTSGKKAFVVAGAGHFVGKNSVLDLLQKQGYQVQQIK